MKTLRQLRREQALSMRDVEKLADVSHQTMVSAESGKPLRLATIRRIADALGVEPMAVAEFAAIIGSGDDSANS